MFSRQPKPVKFAKLVRKDTDIDVIEHLAYDLSELDSMRKQGIPISQNNLESMYYDGDVNCSADVPLDMVRGADINDLWNESQRVNRNLSKRQLRKVSVSMADTQ